MIKYNSLKGILCILLCVVQVSWARDIFVDGSNPQASDKNAGAADKPLKTIAYSAKIAIAGDTVHVRDGVYREFIEVANSGTGPDRMITFRADGSKVFVKGSDEVSGWVLYKDNIWKKEGWQINSQQVFVDGVVLEQIGGNPLFSPGRLPAKGSGVKDMIPGSFYYDEKGKTLYLRLKDNGNPSNHLVEASTRILIFSLKWKNYIKIQNFNFKHSNNTATIKSGWPAVAINGDNCVVENNDISWCDFAGLGGNGNNHVISNNTINHNGNSGMSFSGSGILMVGNTTNFNNYRKFDMDWHAGGVKNTKFVKSTIKNHVAQENKGSGIWCDIDCSDVVIESSKAQKNEGMGIFYEISKNALIKNNIVSENKQHGIYISASQNCNVLNNTAYANMRGIVVHGVPRSAYGKKYLLQNNLVENNILANNSHADLVLAKPSTDTTSNNSDYNLFYQSSGLLNNRLDYAGAMTTLAQWQKNTGNDKHSLVGDPRFKSAAQVDFKILIGSPAIGAGHFSPLLKEDFSGAVRGKQIDIGPYKLSK